MPEPRRGVCRYRRRMGSGRTLRAVGQDLSLGSGLGSGLGSNPEAVRVVGSRSDY